ncbi:MAG: M24 family metallopeptidase, partial [Stellaceae bacterium]
ASTARWEQTMADSRYMSGIGGFGTEALTLFAPGQGATVYVFNRSVYWKKAQNWVADVRDGRNRWAENLKQRLSELGFRGGSIGISGLGALTRSPDGTVPHRTVEALARSFPNARLVDATALMNAVRAVKGAEEIAVIERATAIAEAMAARVTGLKPGDTERTIYAAMIETLLLEGGELPAMLLLGSGPNLAHGSFVAGMRRLEPGDLVVGEIEGRYLGYSGQIVRPAVLGRSTPELARLHDAARHCFEEVRAAMRGGASLKSVVRTYSAAAARAGVEPHFPLMHARGLGDEIPVVLSAEELETQDDVMLENGMAFVLKPRVGRGGLSVQVGDMAAVEPDGGRRLGRAPLSLIEVPWGA